MVRFFLLFAFAMCGGCFTTLHAQDSLSTPKFNVDFGLNFGLRYGFFTANENPSDTALSVIEGISQKGSPGFSVGLSLLVSNENKHSFKCGLNVAYTPSSMQIKRIGKPERTAYVHSLVGEMPLLYQRRLKSYTHSEGNSHFNGYLGLIPQVAVPDLDIPPFDAQIFNVQAAIGGSFEMGRMKKNHLAKTIIDLEFRAGLINLQDDSDDVSSQWFNKFFRNEVVLTVHFL